MSVERVFEILETAPDLVDGHRDLTRSEVGGALAFEGVVFGYDSTRPVLKGIDFQASPGSLVAIVGATGAGKTTLVSLIPRFYDPTGGRVLLDGTDVHEFQLRVLRQQVGMVLQPPLIFPTSVRANIAYGRPDATSEQIEWAATLAQLDDFLARLPQGLDTVVGEGGATLSAGEQLRITIARAFLRDAPILLLDEPPSALDVATEARVMQDLETLMMGRTTFVIAHRLSTVRRADTILVLQDGRIAEQGSFAELVARSGIFATLYQTQFGGEETADDGADGRRIGPTHVSPATQTPSSARIEKDRTNNRTFHAITPAAHPAGGSPLAGGDCRVPSAPRRPCPSGPQQGLAAA